MVGFKWERGRKVQKSGHHLHPTRILSYYAILIKLSGYIHSLRHASIIPVSCWRKCSFRPFTLVQTHRWKLRRLFFLHATAQIQCRTKWNIIISCIVTIFASTYISIIPNVPEPFVELESSGVSNSWEISKRKSLYNMKCLRKRLFMIFLGIVYPEYILAWSVRQYSLAKSLSREYGKSFNCY